MKKSEICKVALDRALSNDSEANYETIYEGFEAMGINEDEILPRENIFTFNAWIAKNRVVKKGEKGVKVTTYIPCKKKDKKTGEEKIIKIKKETVVFHISQTTILNEKEQEQEQEQEQINHYELRLKARRERYKNLAEKAEENSQIYYNQAKNMASYIPFGQPILIGHHSEKRDRNYRNKINNKFEKSFKLLNKVKHYEQKAASVGTGGISSDDTEAITKLKTKLEKCIKSQNVMKECNKIIRGNESEEQKAKKNNTFGFV
ncbi:DUF3560 domain-containing protein [Xenorhabdus stockiae]|uniref:DUF3560 domain-containing protein n=1 Tax=Xenorhabdus stockiae TaxID=351614 RepID=UPI0040632D57